MRDAFARATGQPPIYAGDIWLIADHRLTFGDVDESSRTMHDWRYILVLQGDDDARNALCPTVLVAPLSSNVANKQPWEEYLANSESPLTRPSIVKIHLLQPVPRIALAQDGVRVGSIDDAVLDRMRVHLLENLGIIP